jgi:hypothetical protein
VWKRALLRGLARAIQFGQGRSKRIEGQLCMVKKWMKKMTEISYYT